MAVGNALRGVPRAAIEERTNRLIGPHRSRRRSRWAAAGGFARRIIVFVGCGWSGGRRFRPLQQRGSGRTRGGESARPGGDRLVPTRSAAFRVCRAISRRADGPRQFPAASGGVGSSTSHGVNTGRVGTGWNIECGAFNAVPSARIAIGTIRRRMPPGPTYRDRSARQTARRCR